jgi:hypothetical protein
MKLAFAFKKRSRAGTGNTAIRRQCIAGPAKLSGEELNKMILK